jgi:hypothetical protein
MLWGKEKFLPLPGIEPPLRSRSTLLLTSILSSPGSFSYFEEKISSNSLKTKHATEPTTIWPVATGYQGKVEGEKKLTIHLHLVTR